MSGKRRTSREDKSRLPASASPASATDEGGLISATPERFPIVGIGASAGGLAALEGFFSTMPAETESGIALIVVQHLAPHHKSILAELVQRHTQMRVSEVEEGTPVQPNHVYIIPPNRDLALIGGTLQLLAPTSPHGLRLPIDFFFHSLAQDQQERAICIVLSGTGSDGTLGLRAVKAEGGMVMAQEPDSAEYGGMPSSAIATGLVDYVLRPEAMPPQLIAYADHAFGKRPLAIATVPRRVGTMLKQVCVVLRDRCGHDFSEYKENTLIRRIERRMALHQLVRAQEYLRYLRESPAEVDALFRDLLIGVTSFFRDPEAFAALQQQIIPKLVADAPAGGTLRVWDCGCSTGEEAYSLAILIQEHLDALDKSLHVQIFATDIDANAIEQARSGLYPASIAADIEPPRLARYFSLDPQAGLYRVKKSLRDLLVFSEQDVIKDPPFSKLDLICCRNLLIYLNVDLQKRLIPLFHYALRDDGVLFLGTSESVGEFSDLFASVDRKWKIFRRQHSSAGITPPLFGGLLPHRAVYPAPRAHLAVGSRDAKRITLREVTEQALLAHYVQAALLVDPRGQILHIYGRTGNYLEPAPGDAAMNILDMAREGLRRELTTALHRAVVTKAQFQCSNLRVRNNGATAVVDLIVSPVPTAADPTLPEIYLVLLEEQAQPATAGAPEAEERSGALASEPRDPSDERIALLEQELRAKDDYLQTTLEEMETSNEELKSTNEELQSVNEELQSTNEELETSKEELQSVNEELSTVNAELQMKVLDLSQANNDMNNLLAGTGVGTLFVDQALRITRFTPAATHAISLIPSDVGRPIADMAFKLVGYDRLMEDLRLVLEDLSPRETQVQTRDGSWFLMRIRPYRTLENVIEGAVITFVDISEHKRAAEALRASEQDYQFLFAHMSEGFAYCRAERVDGEIIDFTFLAVNDVFERRSGLSDSVGRRISRLVPGIWQADPALLQVLGRVAMGGGSESLVREVPGLDAWFAISVYCPKALHVAALFEVVTEQKRAEETLRRLAVVVQDSNDAITVHDLDGQISAWNRSAERLYGWTEADALRMNIEEIVPESARPAYRDLLERAGADRPVDPYRTQRRHKDGRLLDVWLTISLLVDDEGSVKGFSTTERLVDDPQ